jgi:HEAT repeat protein
MRAWEDSEESVRRAAHSALLLVRPVDQALLPAIVPLLNSPAESVRARAAQLIAELGPDGASAVEPVEASLRRSVAAGKPDPLLMQALAALGDRGLAPVFASLEQEPSSSLTDADWRLAVLRQVRLTSLARLTEALVHPSASVRAGALEGLIALGDRARSVAKRLPPLLEDTDTAVRSRGWLAAGACGVSAEVMLSRLELGLNDPSPEVRRAVVSGVARLGKAARPAIPKLVEALGTGDAPLELAAVRALGSMGAEAESAAGPLADRVSRATPEVQLEVLAALGSIGTGAASEVGKLLPLGDAPNPQVRRAFFEAIGQFRAGGKPALPAVERLPERFRPGSASRCDPGAGCGGTGGRRCGSGGGERAGGCRRGGAARGRRRAGVIGGARPSWRGTPFCTAGGPSRPGGGTGRVARHPSDVGAGVVGSISAYGLGRAGDGG